MNLELNVVRFNNEDVIATSGECEKAIYKLYSSTTPHGWVADFASTLEGTGLSTYLNEVNCNGAAHLPNVNNVRAEYTYTDSNGTHINNDKVKGVVFHWDANTSMFEPCSLEHKENN